MSVYGENWYSSLKKSPLSPPNSVFGKAWAILYLLLTISLVLVWTNPICKPYCTALNFFFIQLFFNLIWTTVFFRLKMTKVALLMILLIIGLTIKTYFDFSKINNVASYLLIPYLIWLCFATYLNAYIVIKN